MNKQEYLYELEKALRSAHVKDSDDILDEYAEHFDMKLRDGYGEEEVAAKLAPPKDIADQFADIKPGSDKSRGSKILVAIGLGFVDIFLGAFFILLYAWVIVLGALAVASVVLGIATMTGISLWGIIPNMPLICALFLGVALLALGVLSAMGTEYCRLYITRLVKVYMHWHKSVLGNSRRALPPLAIHPVIPAKKSRIMRRITLISLVVLMVSFFAGLGSMMIAAGSLGPWHVWHWFE